MEKVQQSRRWMQSEIVFWTFILVCAALIVSLPAWIPGYMVTGHDMMFHLVRLQGIAEGLEFGTFPVRMNSAWFGGYGMPTGIFYPNLFLYPAALLYLAGTSLLTAWGSFLTMVNVLTAFVSWWAFSKFARSSRTGAIAALFYLGFLYRLVDVYVRSAAGEMLAMAFLPGALVSAWMVLRRHSENWIAVVSCTTAILQSHVLTSLLVFLADGIMVAVSFHSFRDPDVRRRTALAALFTCLLNLWFYAPLIFLHHSMDYVLKGLRSADISGMAGSWAGADFYMGSAMLLLLVVLVLCFLVRRHQQPLPAIFWILVALSALFFVVMGSHRFWHIAGSIGAILQFPFRLAMFPAVFLSLAVAIGLERLGRKSVAMACAGICCVANFYCLLGNGYSLPPRPLPSEPMPMMNGMRLGFLPVQELPRELEWGSLYYHDYMDVSAEKPLRDEKHPERQNPMRAKIAASEIQPVDRIANVQRKGDVFLLQCAEGPEARVQLPLFWYPGYVAENQTNGAACDTGRDSDGQVSVVLPSSAATIRVWYAGLPWFRVTDAISLISLLGFCIMLCRLAFIDESCSGCYNDKRNG